MNRLISGGTFNYRIMACTYHRTSIGSYRSSLKTPTHSSPPFILFYFPASPVSLSNHSSRLVHPLCIH